MSVEMSTVRLTLPVCLFQFHPLWSVFPFVYSLILSAVVSSYVLCSSFSSHFLSSVECSHVMKVSVGDQGLSQLSCKLSRFSCLFPCHMGQIVPCPGFLHTVVISCLFPVVLLSLECSRIIWLISCLSLCILVNCLLPPRLIFLFNKETCYLFI